MADKFALHVTKIRDDVRATMAQGASESTEFAEFADDLNDPLGN